MMDKVQRQVERTGLARSGLLTVLVLACLLGASAVVWRMHMRGKIHQLRVIPVAQENSPSVRPGGQDLVQLNRGSVADGVSSEFSSATLLPGVGMGASQVEVSVRERENVPLLLSTPLVQIRPDGSNADAATFEVWTESHGMQGVARGTVNLLEGRGADRVENNTMPDGGEAKAYFPAVTTAPDGHTTDTGLAITVSTLMSGRMVDLTLTAKNVSSIPRPVTLLWRPRFVAPEGGLNQLTVLPPSAERVVANGRPATGSAVPEPVPLGVQDVDTEYSSLKRTFLSNGPEVRVRNMADGYTLHLTALSPSIRSLRVLAPAHGRAVSLIYTADAGEVKAGGAAPLLQPGATLQWKVRMEVTASDTSASKGLDHNELLRPAPEGAAQPR